MSSDPDYLFEDPPINGQKFVCISVLTPKNFKEETTMHTLKVRGTYDTYEDAKKRALDMIIQCTAICICIGLGSTELIRSITNDIQ